MTPNGPSAAAPVATPLKAIAVVAFLAWFIQGLETATTYAFFQDDPKLGTAVNGSAACVTLYLAVLVVVAFRYSTTKRFWSPPARWILAYMLLAGVSLLWTQSYSLVSASGYWVAFVAELTTIAVLLRFSKAETFAPAALKGFVWASVVLALVAWMAPGTWELRIGQQEYLHPNIIGNQFALAALFCIFLARRYPTTQHWKWVSIGLVFSLLRTLSKASIISFFFAAGFYFLRYSKLGLRNQLKIAFVASIMLLVSWSFIEPYMEVYTEGDNVETFTGRTLIWAVSYGIAAERPWLGHGFTSYISVVPAFSEEFVARTAHNDLLQQFFSYGLVGVLLSLAVYVSFFRHLRRSAPSPQLGLAFALLVYGLLHGLTEASPIELMLPCCMILLLAEWVQEAGRPVNRLVPTYV